MKAYGEWIHIFLTSELAGAEWSVSRPGRFTPGEGSPRYPLDRRLGEPQSRSGRSEEEKILNTTGTRTPTPRSSSPYLVAIPTTLSRLLIIIITIPLEFTKVLIYLRANLTAQRPK
jgi:hypothetical protein